MTTESHALQCDGPSHCRAGSPLTGRLAPKRASGRSGAPTTRRKHIRRGHALCDLSRFSIDFNRFFQGENPTSSADVYKCLRRWEAFCGESVEYEDLITEPSASSRPQSPGLQPPGSASTVSCPWPGDRKLWPLASLNGLRQASETRGRGLEAAERR